MRYFSFHIIINITFIFCRMISCIKNPDNNEHFGMIDGHENRTVNFTDGFEFLKGIGAEIVLLETHWMNTQRQSLLESSTSSQYWTRKVLHQWRNLGSGRTDWWYQGKHSWSNYSQINWSNQRTYNRKIPFWKCIQMCWCSI